MARGDVEARLAAVEDRLAIIELEGLYARSFDARDGDTWAGLFIADGVYQSRDATPTSGGIFVQGRAELSRFCREAAFDGLHLLHLPQISLRADTATSRVHLEFVSMFQGDGTPMARMAGYYDVSYVRDGGQWLIVRRVTTTFARLSTATFGYPTESGLPSS